MYHHSNFKSAPQFIQTERRKESLWKAGWLITPYRLLLCPSWKMNRHNAHQSDLLLVQTL